MDTEQALALARINQARVYTIWFGLGGNSALVARATGLSPSIIDALAHDYHWHQIAGGKLGLEDKKVEREINRVVSYVQGDRLAKVLDRALDLFEDEQRLQQAVVTVTEDGRQVITAKPLVELAKALETAHSIKYRALGDKIAEQADGVSDSPDRIKSLSLTVVNLMNNAAANAKVAKAVTDSVLDVP